MKDLLLAMVDLSFKKFITPNIAAYVYIAGIVCLAVQAVLLTFQFHMPLGLIVGVLFFVFGVLFLRCALEVVLAVFQITRYCAEIARRGRKEDEREDVYGEAAQDGDEMPKNPPPPKV